MVVVKEMDLLVHERRDLVDKKIVQPALRRMRTNGFGFPRFVDAVSSWSISLGMGRQEVAITRKYPAQYVMHDVLIEDPERGLAFTVSRLAYNNPWAPVMASTHALKIEHPRREGSQFVETIFMKTGTRLPVVKFESAGIPRPADFGLRSAFFGNGDLSVEGGRKLTREQKFSGIAEACARVWDLV